MIEIIPNFHPVFVHFPIASATAAVFFIAIGMLFKLKPWAKQCLIFWRWLLWAAAIFVIIAAVFGRFAYNSVKHDEAGHAAMLEHRAWALGTLVFLAVLASWDVWRHKIDGLPTWWFASAMSVAWLMVLFTAWHGGELVYRDGLGVMALPVLETAGHTHEHGDEHVDMPAQAGYHEVASDHGHDAQEDMR